LAVEKFQRNGSSGSGSRQSFGYRVIRDLMQTDARSYFGWTMDITARNRAVVSIPFDAVETRH